MNIQKATIDHCDLLFDWANTPNIRKYSFNPEAISYIDHQHWFKRKLTSSKSFIYIGYKDNSPVGQVRLDKESEGLFFIDIHICPEQQNKGFGKQLLINCISQCYSQQVVTEDDTIQAIVFESNITSQKMFEKCGFELLDVKEVSNILCNILVYKR